MILLVGKMFTKITSIFCVKFVLKFINMTNLEKLLLNYIINIACVSLGVGDINKYMVNNNKVIFRLRISDKQRVSRAFTIVELLVVIVVIGILAAITIISYAGLSSKATVA